MDSLPPPPPARETEPCPPQEPYAVLCARKRQELVAAWREAQADDTLDPGAES